MPVPEGVITTTTLWEQPQQQAPKVLSTPELVEEELPEAEVDEVSEEI